MKKTTRDKLLCLCECAVLLALSCVLSFIVIYKMPMGGGITLVSMLPVLLVGYRHGFKAAFSTAFLYSLFQLFQGIAGGDVFPYCYTIFATVACALFDYIVPFTLLCLTFICRGKSNVFTAVTVSGIMILRFLCHFFTGVVIWDQWAPEGMGKYLYSLIYNGQFMLPELILTVIAMWFVLQVPQVHKK